jgi:hypothetical protein
MTNFDDEQEFSRLFREPQGVEVGGRAPAFLKARLYSAVIRAQQASGSLASLDDTVAAGHGICVFEKLVQISPVGENAQSRFFCHVCHARVLAEKFARPPIYWPHCPYVTFKT